MSTSPFQKNIILPALQLIKYDKKVKKFYFLPGLISILFLTLVLVYQSIYTYVVILWKKEQALEIILNFLHSQYVTEVLIGVVIFVVIYFIMTPVFEWALIRHINERVSWHKVSNSDSLWYGIFRFYPMFEYNNIFGMFKFISIINAYLFVIRFLWLEYINYMTVIFIIAFLFSIVINTITSYTKYEIVLQNKTVFQAIGTSSKIALLNLKTTLKLYMIMFVVNIRVIINFIIFLMFPLLMILAVSLITSKTFLAITIIIIFIIFVIFIIFLGYMTAVLEIFTSAAWYFAYKEGRGKLEKSNIDWE